MSKPKPKPVVEVQTGDDVVDLAAWLETVLSLLDKED